uniref:CSON009158 protein n=1 Tax=Culicoides sonorensis TaxID=179676 RepID=A0A336LNT8_CULSO
MNDAISTIPGQQTPIRLVFNIQVEPSQIASNRKTTTILAILQSGDQRLISGTLERENNTVEELLAKFGVPFSCKSNIQWISNPGSGIDYVVTIGQENSIKSEQQEMFTIHPASTDQEIGKMLIIFHNGEQRLIAFEIPRNASPVREMLKQIGILISNEAQIQCIYNRGADISYVVAVRDSNAINSDGVKEEPDEVIEDFATDCEIAKMLVILQNGKQRLISFTLPRETCTVQELLEQVGVPFSNDSNIRCVSNPEAEIQYVVYINEKASTFLTNFLRSGPGSNKYYHFPFNLHEIPFTLEIHVENLTIYLIFNMAEMSGQQYFQVIDNDELKRMYPSYELVVNDSGVQYGQQQIIQVQSPEQVTGSVGHQQQVQIYQPQEHQTQYVIQQADDGSGNVLQPHHVVYQHPAMQQQQQQQQQQEESAPETQYILELQTPQEQAQAAYNQQIHLQQQQQQTQVQTQVVQSQAPTQQQQPQVVINQSQTQIQTNQQVILHQPQQILLHQQPGTGQTTQQYYVAQPQTQYLINQIQPQDQQQQVQTRIIYQSPPSQNYQIQAQPQRIVFQQRPQMIQSPQVRAQQIIQQQPQQQQQVTPTGLRIVARPQMQGQIQRLQVPTQMQTHIQPQTPAQPVRQRAHRPRNPRNQGPRQPRVNQNTGLQQPTPQTVQNQQKPIVYRLTTPRQALPQQQLQQQQQIQQQQKSGIVQKIGNNVQIRMHTGPKLVLQSSQGQVTQTHVPQYRYVQSQVPNPQVVNPQQPVQSTKAVGGDDMDDIESSITAVIVQKQGPEAADEEFQQRGAAMKRGAQEMLAHSTSKKSVTGPQTAIRSASSISSRSSDESTDRESAKMLVILQSGEQRLITFTLPRETCTVQELLEQVGVPFSNDSNIRCISNPGADIDYVVTVGVSNEDSNELIASAENTLKPVQQQQQPQQMIVTGPNTGNKGQFPQSQLSANKKLQTPDNSVKKDEPQPKFVKGYLAVCNHCGANSYDHAKCQRCKRVFKGEVKILPVAQPNQIPRQLTPMTGQQTPDGQKRPMTQLVQKVPPLKTNLTTVNRGEGHVMRGRGSHSATRGRGRSTRAKVEEPVILTLSSDDEDHSKTSSSSNGNNNAKNGMGSGMSDKNALTPLKCEPVIQENSIPADFCRHDVSGGQKPFEFVCRNIRIGTHKYDPTEKVTFSTRGCRIIAPSVTRPEELVVLNIQLSEIVKILYCFDKRLTCIFMFVLPSCGAYVRESLEMTLNNGPYFNPHTPDNSKKKIVLLMDRATIEEKEKLKGLFVENKIEEITYQDANELLIRSHKDPNAISNQNSAVAVQGNKSENLLLYPKEGKGRIPINTNDYACLAIDQYLNDVIIDFYIKYLLHERLTPEQRDCTHVFSSFFYKRLTTMDKTRRASDKDLKLTAAQKRYQRVSKWNKDVDLFKKDFIIIPINEQSHWFLAIICFPRLTGPVTADGERAVKTPLVKRVKKKNAAAKAKSMTVQIGNTTITAMKKAKDESIEVPGDESERDEAEGDDSELNSDDSGEEDLANPELQPIKQPCILIFDSLSGTSRSRVVATLRDYLTCEYKAKNSTATNPIVFTKDNLPGHCVKVPQQNNFTDCGLYLLQYVEEFYANPIKDWRIPIKGLQNWFDSITVTKKREDISNLLEKLIEKYEPANLPLPKLEFPTKDGVLIEIDETAEFEEADTDPGEGAEEEEGVRIKRRKTEEITA